VHAGSPPLPVPASLGRRAATLVLTGIIWRNSWKYRARTYRHLFWDAGTLLANALAAASALGLEPRLLTGFVDDMIHRLLGVDGTSEVALALLALGPETSPAPEDGPPAAIDHATLPLSHHTVAEPLVTEAHAASALATPDDVIRWRRGRAPAPSAAQAALVALPTPELREGRALGETIQRRGSTRQIQRIGEGLGGIAALGDGRQIEYGKGNHGASSTGKPFYLGTGRANASPVACA